MSDVMEQSKPKYDGRIKKRKWEERIQDAENIKKVCKNSERIKKRKFAMLLSYCGTDYFGMQRNPGMKTIEEDLIQALLKANLITDEAFEQIQTIQFQRAARTDKGVSAARQVMSLKLPEHSTVELINEHLPKCIRVFSLKRVTKGFNSKSQCDARSYMYLLPTYSFAPQNDSITEDNCSQYRLTDDLLDKINSTLSMFVGTKNFHNFTSRKKFKDPSAKRFIMSFNCDKPFINNDMEFVVMKVKGQSFMLHQIRKMVGITISVVRGLTTTETIERSWSEDRIDIPMAPGLGLVLDQVHYDKYNERYGQDGLHEKLDWLDVEEKVQEFKENYIYPKIIETEVKDKSMYAWLQTLPLHSFNVRNEDEKKEQVEFDEGVSSGNENDK